MMQVVVFCYVRNEAGRPQACKKKVVISSQPGENSEDFRKRSSEELAILWISYAWDSIQVDYFT